MSVKYHPVGWNRSKILYDAVLLAGIALYLAAFVLLAPATRQVATRLDEQSLGIKALGSCAFVLMTLVLAIGPLARLNPRFLPLLYNRRHFGVITCTISLAHFYAVLDWYFAFSKIDPWVALLAMDIDYATWQGFPFIVPGIAALIIMLVLAATSHDFWLNFLTPPVWKAIHMSLYAGYGLVATHVALGALQDAGNPGLAAFLAISAVCLVGLHIAAAWRERANDPGRANSSMAPPWIEVPDAQQLADGRGLIVPISATQSAAIFRDGDSLSAISNLCAHQNGPLNEGRVRNGCVICPWHGYEYRLRDGRAPAPYTERLCTYSLKLEAGRLYLDPRPHPPGTAVEPVILPGARA